MQFQPDLDVRAAFFARVHIAGLPPEEQDARWTEAEPNIRQSSVGWVEPRSVAPEDLETRLTELGLAESVDSE